VSDLRIGLIDSNELVRSGRSMIINSQPDMRVVLEESDPVVAIQRAPDYLVDVLLVGPSQHSLRGQQLIQLLSQALVEAKNECAIISYNAFTSSKLRYEAVISGAQDFIGLDSSGKELLSLIRQVVKRDFLVEPNELSKLAGAFGYPKVSNQLELKLSELTDVNTKVVTLFLAGQGDQAIAKQLDLARTRVTQLIDSLIASAGLTSRNQLHLALSAGSN
jgi:DNA-binding NarL/FixJ family response regulator